MGKFAEIFDFHLSLWKQTYPIPINKSKASPYTGDKLTEIEKISYQCKRTYRGDIRHLFLFYPFDERLDAWERENRPQNKGSSSVSDRSSYQ